MSSLTFFAACIQYLAVDKTGDKVETINGSVKIII